MTYPQIYPRLRVAAHLRKFNARSFMAIPITSQHRDQPYHFRFHFHGELRGALLSQARSWTRCG